jgi:hypothetical protein
VRYEPAAPNPTATGCQTGTIALARAVRTVFPELESLTTVYGCYSRRYIRGTTTWSIHAEGRAFDVGVPDQCGETGWQLACELVARRTLYGVQRVMWDGHIWSVESPSAWRSLSPRTDQHRSHVHVEQYRAAAARPRTVEPQYVTALRASRLPGPMAG